MPEGHTYYIPEGAILPETNSKDFTVDPFNNLWFKYDKLVSFIKADENRYFPSIADPDRPFYRFGLLPAKVYYKALEREGE